MSYTATYSPDDNKLRLYAATRLPQDIFERVKAAGFRWAPKQDLFVAPMWTPGREDLLIALAGEIDDEDKSIGERAEERAERFDGYRENRTADAESARKAVAAIADGIPLGQPILVGHHSEKRARRDAEKIENGMRAAVKAWKTAEYWQRRAAGAISHAKYKERPDVRARRIRGIEADLRKVERADKESSQSLALFALVDQPEKWKPGGPATREERAAYVAGRVNATVKSGADGRTWTAYDVLRLPVEERYKDAPAVTIDEVLEIVRRSFGRATEYRARWREHYANRLSYERAMLAADGGTVSDRVTPEKGGGCRCWASPRGGWSYIQKVNRVSVTVWDQWNEGGRVFSRNIPFDKLARILSAADVQAARDRGELVEHPQKLGFHLTADAPRTPTPPTTEAPKAAEFRAMAEALNGGTAVQVVSAPQLFPTPRGVAARLVELADIQPGARVLEPSAGTGALIGAMGGRMFGHAGGALFAVEVNAKLAERLRSEFPLTTVHTGDFLEWGNTLAPSFDRVLMNPPFENGADIKHIRHALAMVKPGGRMVAICADGPRQREALQQIASSWEELPAGTFEGTNVRAALITIDKGAL